MFAWDSSTWSVWDGALTLPNPKVTKNLSSAVFGNAWVTVSTDGFQSPFISEAFSSGSDPQLVIEEPVPYNGKLGTNGVAVKTGIALGFEAMFDAKQVFLRPDDLMNSFFVTSGTTTQYLLKGQKLVGGMVDYKVKTYRSFVLSYIDSGAVAPPAVPPAQGATTSGVHAVLWNAVLDPSVTYAELWTRFPDEMPSVAQTAYMIRETTRQTALIQNIRDIFALQAEKPDKNGGSGGGYLVSDVAASALINGAVTGRAIGELALIYPQEVLQFGNSLIELQKSVTGFTPSVANRFKEVVYQLQSGTTLDGLVANYADVLATGAYDLIQLDKWLKTGVFPQ
jgi:hypothetical protein